MPGLRSGLVARVALVLDPALVRGCAEEGNAVRKQRVRHGRDGECPPGEHQRQRRGIAPSLRRGASGKAHGVR